MSKKQRGRPVKNVIRKIPATAQEIAQTIFKSADDKTKPQTREKK